MIKNASLSEAERAVRRMSLQPTQPHTPRIGHWRSTLLVAAVVLGAYLLLLNPYWTPGGDSELFIASARSIVRSEGYTYNGLPVRIAPPAWPYVMAAAMSSIAAELNSLATVTIIDFYRRWVRPAGTDSLSTEALADLVTRDAMIGTARVAAP